MGMRSWNVRNVFALKSALLQNEWINVYLQIRKKKAKNPEIQEFCCLSLPEISAVFAFCSLFSQQVI